MEPKDKIIRAKIQLQSKAPFFAYLLSHLNIIEDEKLKIPTCAVDNRDNLSYHPKFIDSLKEKQVEGVLCHEVLHKAFEHIDRFLDKERDMLTWNIAADIVVNNILINNGFDIRIKGIIVPCNNQITVLGKTIVDIGNKTAETIYDELFTHIRGLIKKGKFKTTSDETGFGFDSHIYGEKNDKDKKTEGKKDWKKITAEANAMSKTRGNVPWGIDRQIDELLHSKLNWKEILYRYITNSIPHDYTYAKPSKHSQACGFYMPSLKREEVEIVVAVDTSGSIGQQELTEFLSEMVSISKSFSNIKMTCLICDADIHNVLEFTNGNLNEILNIKLQGGGGTSHAPIYKWLDDNKPNTKLLIAFSDGYTELPKQINYKTLWIINSGGTDEVVKNTGEIIKL